MTEAEIIGQLPASVSENAGQQAPAGTAAEIKKDLRIYIVKTQFSSENIIESSEEVSKKKTMYTYRFQKPERDAIKRVRMRYCAPIYSHTVDYIGLHICEEAQIKKINDAIIEADKAYKLIRDVCITSYIEECEVAGTPITRDMAERAIPELGAKVRFIEIALSDSSKGGLYKEIVDAIYYQIYNVMFARIDRMLQRSQKTGKELNARSRTALENLTDSLRSLNIMRSDEIDLKLDDLRKQVLENDIRQVSDALKEELDAGKSRWAAIEL